MFTFIVGAGAGQVSSETARMLAMWSTLHPPFYWGAMALRKKEGNFTTECDLRGRPYSRFWHRVSRPPTMTFISSLPLFVLNMTYTKFRVLSSKKTETKLNSKC